MAVKDGLKYGRVESGAKEKEKTGTSAREIFCTPLKAESSRSRTFSFPFFRFGRQPKNVPVADVSTEGVCMLFVNTLPYGTQYDHHNTQ